MTRQVPQITCAGAVSPPFVALARPSSSFIMIPPFRGFFPMFRLPLFSALIALVVSSSLFPVRAAEDNLDSMLAGFIKKLSAQAEPATDATGVDRRVLPAQLRALHALLVERKYERAQAALGALMVYGLPADLQAEWVKIENALQQQVKEAMAKQNEAWQAKVDRLVSDAKATCLGATIASDVEPLLVRVTGLQLERNTNGTVLAQRYGRKLDGVVSLATAWSNYLDYKAAGNEEAQNTALKTLLSDNAFPILTRSEIEARIEAAQSLSVEKFARILEGLRSLEDLPKTVQELKAAASRPAIQARGMPRLDGQNFELLLTLWEAVKQGDLTVLSQWPSDYAGSYTPQVQSTWRQYRDEIATLFLAEAFKGRVNLPPKPRELAEPYAERLLQTLREKRGFETMTEVYRLRQSLLLAAPKGENWASERAQFETLAAARRFEVAGDTLGAITAYRSIVGGAAGKYFPMDEATEALKRLRAANPAAFNDVQGVVLEELRSLRQQLQQPRRFPGPPYSR
jgi:hypothetical protein